MTPTGSLARSDAQSHPRMDRCRQERRPCLLRPQTRLSRRASPQPRVKIIYLKGTYALFAEESTSVTAICRRGHPGGQFADLEEPEDAIMIDAARSPDEIVAEIRRRLVLS